MNSVFKKEKFDYFTRQLDLAKTPLEKEAAREALSMFLKLITLENDRE